MSYISTELSESDLQNLNDIYHLLSNIHIPTTFKSNEKHGANHSKKTGTTDQRGARQTLFKIGSKSAIRYPEIFDKFRSFIEVHVPDFKFESVYVNKNTICKKHLDSGNGGKTLLVGFGDYTGGDTVLVIDCVEKHFNISKSSIIFDGSKIVHSSEPFNGTRYSLVFF